MTQQEYDNKMILLNRQMQQEYDEVDSLMAENHRQRDFAKEQIRHWGGVIDTYKRQANDLHNRKKEIARKYYELRRQHFVNHPKSPITE